MQARFFVADHDDKVRRTAAVPVWTGSGDS